MTAPFLYKTEDGLFYEIIPSDNDDALGTTMRVRDEVHFLSFVLTDTIHRTSYDSDPIILEALNIFRETFDKPRIEGKVSSVRY